MKTSSIVVAALATFVACVLGYVSFAGWSATKTGDPSHSAEQPDKPGGRADRDEHMAERIRMSDVKLAAGGASLAAAGPAVLDNSLSFNGVLRANQEAVVQVTPRFPGIVRSIRARIGDTVARDALLATVESNQSLTTYELKAPISGTIIDRQISLGEYASEQKPAFIVADLSTVWVDLSIYRQDLGRVRVGNEVAIDLDDDAPAIRGTVDYVAPVGATETQTALARVVLANREGRLRPGLFVTARLVLSKLEVPVAVRSEAVQTLGNRTVVFVREEGDKLEARPVEVGESDANFVQIRTGLAAGERYVAVRSFVVKAEMGKEESQQ